MSILEMWSAYAHRPGLTLRAKISDTADGGCTASLSDATVRNEILTVPYHETSAPKTIIAPIPRTGTKICEVALLGASTTATYPANASTTPKQKTSNECWPQLMTGRKIHDVKGARFAGINRSTRIAIAKKCAKRVISKLVLLSGGSSHSGT
jgi:hypothetical protein